MSILPGYPTVLVQPFSVLYDQSDASGGIQLMGRAGAPLLPGVVMSGTTIAERKASIRAVCVQALNVLMLKTLENSNRTYAFTALLLLTREPPPELRHRPPEAAKFFDLAVKCLIKISKALSDDLQARLAPVTQTWQLGDEPRFDTFPVILDMAAAVHAGVALLRHSYVVVNVTLCRRSSARWCSWQWTSSSGSWG